MLRSFPASFGNAGGYTQFLLNAKHCSLLLISQPSPRKDCFLFVCFKVRFRNVFLKTRAESSRTVKEENGLVARLWSTLSFRSRGTKIIQGREKGRLEPWAWMKKLKAFVYAQIPCATWHHYHKGEFNQKSPRNHHKGNPCVASFGGVKETPAMHNKERPRQ